MADDPISKPLDAYVRVSRVGGREGDSFISPEVQREKIETYTKARGFEIAETFVDLDQSPQPAIACVRSATRARLWEELNLWRRPPDNLGTPMYSSNCSPKRPSAPPPLAL